MRREKELPQGALPGESMNVFVAIQELDLSPGDGQAIDPILLDYEIAIDAALARRRETMDKYQEVLKDAMISKDTDSGLNALRKIGATRTEVCILHMDVIEELISALPEDASISFRKSILAAGFPSVFEPTKVDTLLTAIRKLTDLTPEQVGQIDMIEARYREDLVVANDRLIEAFMVHGAEIPILEAKRAIARRNKEPVQVQKTPDEINALQTTKDEMVEKYWQQLREVLSDQQLAIIPRTMNDRRKNRESRAPSGAPSGSRGSGSKVKPGDTRGPTILTPSSIKGGDNPEEKPGRALPAGGSGLPQNRNPSF